MPQQIEVTQTTDYDRYEVDLDGMFELSDAIIQQAEFEKSLRDQRIRGTPLVRPYNVPFQEKLR